MLNQSRIGHSGPLDFTQIAYNVYQQATADKPEIAAQSDTEPVLPVVEKDPNAVALGRRGGLVGGKARSAKMTAEERSESARKAAAARWANRQGG